LCEQIKRADFALLPITQAHLAELIDLPFIHRDPFDRLLISVVKAEKMTILTIDEKIQEYDVPYIW
jgi:PIN domain nuclease of toxin-antitoxin system